MSLRRHHEDWLSLVPASGPFLSPPVLKDAFPQGLPQIDREVRERLRLAWEEWNETPADDAIHRAWVRFVLREALDWDSEVLVDAEEVRDDLVLEIPEHRERIAPTWVLRAPGAPPEEARVLVTAWPRDTDLDEAPPGSAWAATPADRTARLCREAGIPLGLATDGERWTLVWASSEGTPGFASWYADLWFQEPRTLEAFISLLEAQRFFGMPEDQSLEHLYEASKLYQTEVTDRLGEQVRTAVEVLIQALDRADADTGRTLLANVAERRLYEAAVTVMMRLVFLFHAEERGLLLLGAPVWDEFYSVSLLRDRLRAEADRVGLEVLERRKDAWIRLLAAFRAVYGGARHQEVSLPAYGGSLFAPDRFPFLEGRDDASSWRNTSADPLPVDNRTVLHLLESLQQIEGRRLSFEGLDIEQIGHVYEGLLDHVAVRVDEPTVGLIGTKSKGEPEIGLSRLETAREKGRKVLVDIVNDETGRSKSAIRNALERDPNDDAVRRLRVACGNDESLLGRVLPFHDLIRDDVWGYPVVYRAGSVMVTGGPDRRETGTHYTPKSIAQEMVRDTLQPLVYEGPIAGRSKNEWRLRSPERLLDLKVCDPAMGSGAFLVTVCRWLGERLVESWSEHGTRHEPDSDRPLPDSPEERALLARRLVAERCIHGVDVNPMAVELAKLSIWLVTLGKARPFGFLDHALRPGDSLLGVHDADQIRHFHVVPERGSVVHRTLFDFTEKIAPALKKAMWLRQELETLRVVDVRDVRRQEAMEIRARRALDDVVLIADLVTAAALAKAEDSDQALDELLVSLSEKVNRLLSLTDAVPVHVRENLNKAVRTLIESVDRPHGKSFRPFHWPVAFPEVFLRQLGGFDAIVGNPPFLGGKLISVRIGDAYNAFLKTSFSESKGAADLCAYFFRRAVDLVREGGAVGLLATNTIAQTATRDVGLAVICRGPSEIFKAVSRVVWPGRANVHVSAIHLLKGQWSGPRTLDGASVPQIGPRLQAFSLPTGKPQRLTTFAESTSAGTGLLGIDGFLLDPETRHQWIRSDPAYNKILKPYINAKELSSLPRLEPVRYVIDLNEFSEEEAYSRYPLAMERLSEIVKPRRDKLTRQIHEADYWKHWDKRARLYSALEELDRTLVAPLVTRHLPIRFLPTGWIYSKELVVFPSANAAHFSLLQSIIHHLWARLQSGTLKSDLSYSISRAFRTFPTPDVEGEERLRSAGEEYSARRQEIMESEELGLTDIYNMLHDPDCHQATIEGLRKCQQRMEDAVLEVFGWFDLQSALGFHEIPMLPADDRVRYTFSFDVQEDVLSRLLILNRERFKSVSRPLREAQPGDLRARNGTPQDQDRLEGPLFREVAEPETNYGDD